MTKIIFLFLIFTLPSFSADLKKETMVAALTFDDGPNPEFLKNALPYLEKENVKATFFVIGFKAKKYPDFIDKMFKSGHEIANHSMNHVCLVRPSPKWSGCPDLSEEKAIKEVNDASLAIQKITGKKPSFLRPPHFAMTPSRKNAIEESLGIKVLIHGSNSVGSLDWSFNDKNKIFNQVKKTITERNFKPVVIVFHERNVTLEALPEIIKFMREAGYKFVTLEEFVKIAPKANI